MPASKIVRHILGAHFYSSMTLGVVVCLYSPQTGVRPLCDGTLGSLSTTLGIFIRHCIPQTRVCLRLVKVPSWLQPSVLLSVASQKSFLCPARLSGCRMSSHPLDRSLSAVCWDLYFVWHDPRCSRSSF